MVGCVDVGKIFRHAGFGAHFRTLADARCSGRDGVWREVRRHAGGWILTSSQTACSLRRSVLVFWREVQMDDDARQPRRGAVVPTIPNGPAEKRRSH